MTTRYTLSERRYITITMSLLHWRAVRFRFSLEGMLTSGLGFFTDAYDLFIIGVVLAILTPIWNLTKFEISLIGNTSLIAAAIGSILFGRLAD